MENSITRWIYRHSPVAAQNLFCSAYGVVKRCDRYFGKHYQHFFDLFQASERWSFEELRAYQNERLAEVVRHAYEHVPFYRRRFDSLHLKPADIRTVEDLAKLPYLTKSDIRGAGTDLRADDCKGRVHVIPSGGSTGTPTLYWRSKRSHQMEYAFTWSRRRPGVKQGEPYASFTGVKIQPPNSFRRPFWRANWAANQRMYSTFHMTDTTMPLYLDDLQKHPRVWLEGYVTPIYLLAKYILDHHYPFSAFPRAVFTTSEELTPRYREAIETAFRTKVYDQYGQGEQSSSITQYACGHLHNDMAYAITEFIPVGQQGDMPVVEIIGTSLYNEAMPLIRCQTGDTALLPSRPVACPHSAGQIVEAIRGRTGHVLVTRDGRRISNPALSLVTSESPNVKAMQYVQDEIGAIRVLVVRESGYGAEDEAQMLRLLRQQIGESDTVVVEHVQELIRTDGGKTLPILSRLPRQ
ncbi:MAG: phenylacetate--CoA ligase family protein [Phycisphaerae bacterium]|nr:phenylacetate--CoA ligase family protein [Phycisphaerae bacterium]